MFTQYSLSFTACEEPKKSCLCHIPWKPSWEIQRLRSSPSKELRFNVFKMEQRCSAEGGKTREKGELAVGQADLWGWQWARWAVTFAPAGHRFKAQVELKNTFQQTCAAPGPQPTCRLTTTDITYLFGKTFCLWFMSQLRHLPKYQSAFWLSNLCCVSCLMVSCSAKLLWVQDICFTNDVRFTLELDDVRFNVRLLFKDTWL